MTAYYNANKTTYAPSDTRSLSQVVVQDQATANAIAQRAKGGATLAAAAAPAGSGAAVTTLQDQTRGAYAGGGRGQGRECGVLRCPGAVVGPLQSDFGWVVVKVDSVKAGGGKTLEQARAEIAAKLTADKRKAAIEDLVDKVQSALDNGSNFSEAVGAAKLAVTATPLITAERNIAHGRHLQAAAGARARAEDRVRHRAQRPARDRHSSKRGGLCDRLAGTGRRRGAGAAGVHP